MRNGCAIRRERESVEVECNKQGQRRLGEVSRVQMLEEGRSEE